MTKKVGRPRDEFRAIHRQLFPDWSERTFARYYAAVAEVRKFGAFIEDDDWAKAAMLEATDRATRPSGSLNVSEYVRASHEAVDLKTAELIRAGRIRYKDDHTLIKCQLAEN